jgi:hypothetical protein
MEGKDSENRVLATAASSCKALGLITLAVAKEQGEAAAAPVFAKAAPALAHALGEHTMTAHVPQLCALLSTLASSCQPLGIVVKPLVPCTSPCALLVRLADAGSAETRLSAAAAVKAVAKAAPALTRTALTSVVSALVKALKDTTPAVKSAVERSLLHVLEVRAQLVWSIVQMSPVDIA